MTLKETYQDIADLWRAAARAYADRAAKASTITKNRDPDSPWSWDEAAARASRRAARYARLAEESK
jgi:acyl-CoA synthetase (AMP-forming)/AMP-acid ligase II